MLSYHNDKKIKAKYVNRIKEDGEADRIIKGQYWESGKGCAVGCTIRGSSHKEYEIQLGVPRALARLEDRIFEGLPNAEAMKWPLQFLKAIPIGVDLTKVSWQFLKWVLGEIKVKKENKDIKAILDEVAEFLTPLTQGGKVNIEDARRLRDKCWSIRSRYYAAAAADAAAAAAAAAYAAAAAAYAADAAAYAAAAAAAAADAAAYAAYAAAAYAAAAAAYAADAAAYAAYAADAAAYAAAAAARNKSYSKMAKKLIELIKGA